MRYLIITIAILYFLIALGVFAMQTQLPVTFWLAVLRSVFWPVWFFGGLQGVRLPIGDQYD